MVISAVEINQQKGLLVEILCSMHEALGGALPVLSKNRGGGVSL